MVRQISTWEASDGSHHPDKESALRRELCILLTGLSESQAIATKIVCGLTRASAAELSRVIEDLGTEMPQ